MSTRPLQERVPPSAQRAWRTVLRPWPQNVPVAKPNTLRRCKRRTFHIALRVRNNLCHATAEALRQLRAIEAKSSAATDSHHRPADCVQHQILPAAARGRIFTSLGRSRCVYRRIDCRAPPRRMSCGSCSTTSEEASGRAIGNPRALLPCANGADAHIQGPREQRLRETETFAEPSDARGRYRGGNATFVSRTVRR